MKPQQSLLLPSSYLVLTTVMLFFLVYQSLLYLASSVFKTQLLVLSLGRKSSIMLALFSVLCTGFLSQTELSINWTPFAINLSIKLLHLTFATIFPFIRQLALYVLFLTLFLSRSLGINFQLLVGALSLSQDRPPGTNFLFPSVSDQPSLLSNLTSKPTYSPVIEAPLSFPSLSCL